jgi:hypothetical protein
MTVSATLMRTARLSELRSRETMWKGDETISVQKEQTAKIKINADTFYLRNLCFRRIHIMRLSCALSTRHELCVVLREFTSGLNSSLMSYEGKR